MTDQTACYLLAAEGQYPPGSLIAVTEDAAGGSVCIAADPRQLPPSEIVPRLGPAELILGPAAPEPGYCLVRVASLGTVAVFTQFNDCPGTVWRAEAEEPLDALIGPQADHIRAALTLAEARLVFGADPDACTAYDNAVRAIPADRWAKALDAAVTALINAGADGWWWTEGFGFEYGAEIVALAARDLIGEHGEWTRTEYDLLTSPWLAAFGRRIHPDDTRIQPGT